MTLEPWTSALAQGGPVEVALLLLAAVAGALAWGRPTGALACLALAAVLGGAAVVQRAGAAPALARSYPERLQVSFAALTEGTLLAPSWLLGLSFGLALAWPIGARGRGGRWALSALLLLALPVPWSVSAPVALTLALIARAGDADRRQAALALGLSLGGLWGAVHFVLAQARIMGDPARDLAVLLAGPISQGLVGLVGLAGGLSAWRLWRRDAWPLAVGLLLAWPPGASPLPGPAPLMRPDLPEWQAGDLPGRLVGGCLLTEGGLVPFGRAARCESPAVVVVAARPDTPVLSWRARAELQGATAVYLLRRVGPAEGPAADWRVTWEPIALAERSRSGLPLVRVAWEGGRVWATGPTGRVQVSRASDLRQAAPPDGAFELQIEPNASLDTGTLLGWCDQVQRADRGGGGCSLVAELDR